MNAIKKPIYPKLNSRYNVSQDQQPLYLGNVLVPTTSADDLTAYAKVQQTASSAASRSDAYTVPTGKMWKLKFVQAQRDVIGSVQITCVIDGVSMQLYYNSAVTALISTTLSLNDMRLKQGDVLNVVFGAAAAGTLNSGIIYDEYDTQ